MEWALRSVGEICDIARISLILFRFSVRRYESQSNPSKLWVLYRNVDALGMLKVSAYLGTSVGIFI